VVTAGEAYWLKLRSPLNVISMLQPMPPARVTPQVVDGLIAGYSVQDGRGSVIPLEAKDVIRFWFPDPEAIFTSEGYLAPNAAVADAQKFADQHLRSHYQSDATPAMILKAGIDAAEPKPEQWERFQAQWVQKYSNRQGTHRGVPSALPAGWDAIFTAIASGADITPLLEYWQSNQLMNFGVPASVLGRVISGDRSAAETNQFVFDLHTITPIAEMMANALTLQLAGDFDPKIFVAFEDFVSADKVFDLQREAQDLALKIKSPQQVLIDRGEDPDLAPWGVWPAGTLSDTPYTGEEREFSMFGGGESESDIEDPPEDSDEEVELAPGQEDESGRTRKLTMQARAVANWEPALSMARVLQREKKFVPPFGRSLRRVFKKQHNAVKLALKEQRSIGRVNPIDANDLFDPKGWGPLFDAETQVIREQAYLYAAQESMGLLGFASDFEYSVEVAQQLRLQGAEMVTLVNKTTASRIRKALTEAMAESAEEGDTLANLTKKIDEVFKGRRRNSATIARTEMHRATQSGQMESFKQADVPFKIWLDSRDSNVRETHFQEGILPARQEADFLLPSGFRCKHPGDMRLPASESINCRCDAAPVFGLDDV